MEHNSSYGYLTDCREVPITFPPQHQDRQPGFEYVMEPKPVSECGKACRKLEGKTALVTGICFVWKASSPGCSQP